MVMNGEKVLAASLKGRSLDELEISCGNQDYRARVSFFRNRAIASYVDGEWATRLSGSLTGRSYEAIFNANDEGALPVALFLLWYIVANRRSAYCTGKLTRGVAT